MATPSNINTDTSTAGNTSATSPAQRVYPPNLPLHPGEEDQYSAWARLQHLASYLTSIVSTPTIALIEAKVGVLTADQERRFGMRFEKEDIEKAMLRAQFLKTYFEGVKEVLETEKEDAFAGTGGWYELRKAIKLERAGDLQRARERPLERERGEK